MPVAEHFQGTFGFADPRAFLIRNGANPALLQDDDPFTGIFDDGAAKNTAIRLRSSGVQQGDPADLSGLIRFVDVNGQQAPVLFLFQNANGSEE